MFDTKDKFTKAFAAFMLAGTLALGGVAGASAVEVGNSEADANGGDGVVVSDNDQNATSDQDASTDQDATSTGGNGGDGVVVISNEQDAEVDQEQDVEQDVTQVNAAEQDAYAEGDKSYAGNDLNQANSNSQTVTQTGTATNDASFHVSDIGGDGGDGGDITQDAAIDQEAENSNENELEAEDIGGNGGEANAESAIDVDVLVELIVQIILDLLDGDFPPGPPITPPGLT